MSSSSRPSDVSKSVDSDSDSDSGLDIDPNLLPLPLLWTRVRPGLSVESAKLKIVSGDGERHIYSDIHINGGICGKAYRVYHRTSDEAEIVSSEGDLTLCGPNYFLYVKHPDMVYVSLHEGGVPFLEQRFPLDLGSLKLNQSITVAVTGEKAILTITMTCVSPSVLTRVFLFLVNATPSDEWLVSGTVTANQTLPGGQIKRSLTLFKRPDSNPFQLVAAPIINLGAPYSTPAQAITLDRPVVLAPVHVEDEVVEKFNDLLLGEGCISPFVDAADLNGIGSSLSIDVELKFMDVIDHNMCAFVNGTMKAELKGSHEEAAHAYFEYMKGVIKPHNCKHSSSTVGSSSKGDDKLKIMAMVRSFSDLFMEMTEEVFEDKLPLYSP